MAWTAPPLQHLLEARLRDARLDLFSDGRLAVTQNEDDSPEFATALIEKKLAAAAANGLDAVEASLRLAASEALSKSGIGPEESRATLKKAGEKLRNVSVMKQHPGQWRPSPVHFAGGLFVAWCIVAAVIGASANFPWWAHLLLQGLGLATALAAFKLYAAQLARASRQQKNELPAVVCRQYMEQLTRLIAEYEQTVQILMKSREV